MKYRMISMAIIVFCFVLSGCGDDNVEKSIATVSDIRIVYGDILVDKHSGLLGSVGGLLVAGPVGALIGGGIGAATASNKTITRAHDCVIVVNMEEEIIYLNPEIFHRIDECETLKVGDHIKIMRFGGGIGRRWIWA